MIEVRATVAMAGLSAGQEVYVDEELDHMKMLLENGYLVPTGRTYVAPTAQAHRAVRPRPAPAPEAKQEPKPKAARSRRSPK